MSITNNKKLNNIKIVNRNTVKCKKKSEKLIGEYLLKNASQTIFVIFLQKKIGGRGEGSVLVVDLLSREGSVLVLDSVGRCG